MFNALVVDDEEDIGDFLKEQLDMLGLAAVSATTGERALELLDQKTWAFAVVDLRLSTSITGLQVIKAIREKSPNTIVMAMTGYVDVGLRQEAEKLGVSDFLSKPDDVQPKVFIPKIEMLLSKIGFKPAT